MWSPVISRILIAAAVLAFSTIALANDYGVFLEVESDEDLLDLLAAQEIETDTYETLRELLEDA